MAIARELQPQDTRLTPRRNYAEVESILPVPNLIQIQRESFDWFVREGLKELFAEISPIQDFTTNKLELRFIDYEFDEPKYTETECRERDFTYSAPLRIKVQLLIKETGEVKEQTIYMGDFPKMTEQGTFIINGAERVVVSQLVRSPGVYFTREMDPTSGRALCYAKLIPSRGAWLEFETSNKDVISVKVDRKRKLPVTILLRAIGYGSDDELLELFENSAPGDRDYIRETIQRDPTKSQDEALLEFYRRLRPGDPPTADNARNLIQSLFFNFRRYDLGKVGRYKLNKRLGQQIPQTQRVLTKEDIIRIIEVIMELNNGQGHFDDIDHLGNRRIRAVGELIQGQFRVGLLRMERTVKERMSIQEPTTATPAALINIRPVVAAMKEFFGGSQLSQFMDQTNPLAELTHKRRLSALGPGGLNRDRAGVEVRDVHHSHYGRICPIETPEGANIGLIGYLASYGKINEYGFIETPYRRVYHQVPSNSPNIAGHTLRERVTDPRTNEVIAESGSIITEELAQRLAALPERNIRVRAFASHDVVFLSADVEDEHAIAQANSILMANGEFKDDRVEVRFHQEFQTENIDQVEYMDVSPMQMVSIATALIPFVEHDEANRALMGANMQRQAVPLIQPESPDVGTGIERQVAQDSGQVVLSRVDGVITSINGREIIITDDEGNEHKHYLRKFVRSNQGTCINQRTIVNIGDRVKQGAPLADSYSTDKGELALGRNIIVAFMSFDGGNFEDAIIISENLVREDKFTSVHIERYDIEARETKLGPEEITRDIPNVGDDALRDLDERGIIRIGAEVRPGDILVGKITPKGETELTAEERLLRAIFGEKAREVRDTSLRVPHGERGKVVDVRIFSRENHDELPAGVNQLVRVSIAQKRKIVEGDKMAGRHGNKGVVSRILPIEDMPFLPDGRPVEIILNPIGVPSRMNVGQILETHLGWAAMALGMKVATPVFDGAHEEDIQNLLDQAGLPPDGKTVLIDGKTGEPFDQRVTVGNMYMLKLIHQVEDKVHARSTGPYSLITQQPLGGKAQFGGQRLGEMEVWALEAYGAAHILQEMLTVKSDDVQGRVHTYEAIVKGENIVEPGVPESFKVLVKELQSLGLAVEVLNEDEAPIQFVTEDTSEEGPNEHSLGINLSGRELTDFE